ncbi:MAG: hypothetical protein IT353_19850 [Gemmatimonadaceae bacterium]|nr:hypothetical protein [Gemmatimonadaceae bacterium]
MSPRQTRFCETLSVIAFAPGVSWALREIAEATQADAVGVDWHTSPHAARAQCLGLDIAMQGNLDPCALYGSPAEIRRRTHEMIAAFGPVGHVANLGHGILPDVPPAHARAFVDAVKERRWTGEAIAASHLLLANTPTSWEFDERRGNSPGT